ncbi:hypothetical protein KZO11_34200 [Streptomyces anulatus]|uniref:hypothetical protein n=1 Tax=Streptomyces anulatus TaxID=1892 RepID=UPI001C5D2D5E|nr:hypothetical protein [Streptomyces anulatus]QYA98289.1 hypothetical protein KZO11_34200 [Streptomyces anulatus]
MSMSKPTKHARTDSRYTGAPCQLASDVVAALPPGAPLIPTPERAQMLFESEVFYWVLSGMRDFFEYPFGIQYVQPTTTGIREKTAIRYANSARQLLDLEDNGREGG